MTRHVLLCRSDGTVTETASKEDAHLSPGMLHRAFSVFVFRTTRKNNRSCTSLACPPSFAEASKGGQDDKNVELLIQKRHTDKLFGGLWANTCCSHVRHGCPCSSFIKARPERSRGAQDDRIQNAQDDRIQSLSDAIIVQQAERRLLEEFGFSVPLSVGHSFVYRAEDTLKRGVEHEFDTILTGTAENAVEIRPDPAEVADWRWIKMEELRQEITLHPNAFAPWFPVALTLLRT